MRGSNIYKQIKKLIIKHDLRSGCNMNCLKTSIWYATNEDRIVTPDRSYEQYVRKLGSKGSILKFLRGL